MRIFLFTLLTLLPMLAGAQNRAGSMQAGMGQLPPQAAPDYANPAD